MFLQFLQILELAETSCADRLQVIVLQISAIEKKTTR